MTPTNLGRPCNDPPTPDAGQLKATRVTHVTCDARHGDVYPSDRLITCSNELRMYSISHNRQARWLPANCQGATAKQALSRGYLRTGYRGRHVTQFHYPSDLSSTTRTTCKYAMSPVWIPSSSPCHLFSGATAAYRYITDHSERVSLALGLRILSSTARFINVTL